MPFFSRETQCLDAMVSAHSDASYSRYAACPCTGQVGPVYMGTLACAVEDVTMRLAAPAAWAAASLVAPPGSLGASPVYNPGCDSAESGMRGTLFWTLPGARILASTAARCQSSVKLVTKSMR